MAAQYLPKEHEKLPTDLPLEIPSHAEHGHTADESAYTATVKPLLSWHAPGRPFRQRGKEYFASVILITMLIEVIAFLLSQYVLMATILGLAFLAVALATVPPRDSHYRLSTQGITVDDYFFLWEELYDFYFKRRDGITVVHVRVQGVPGELTLSLGDMNQEHVKEVLARFIPYREVVKATFMEKAGDWLGRNFPLEKTSPKKQA